MAYRWETPASVWLEDEHSGQFELLASEGLGRIDRHAQARGRLPDVARLLGASLPTSCDCAPVYPEGFAFCPNCGRPLDRMTAHSTPADWWGPHSDLFLPRHVPHGLPVTSVPLADSLEQRQSVPHVGRFDVAMRVPPNAHCVFAAAGYGFPVQRLLALAFTRGVLQYWDPMAQLWHVMAPEGADDDLVFTESGYAWLPAFHPQRGEVAIVPTACGLRRLWVNPVNESFRTEPVLEGRIVAAPGQMRSHIACLYQDGQGVWLWSARSDDSERQGYDCGDVPAAGWTQPFGYDGRLFWLHEQGQLVWRPGEAPRFMPWPQGWQPRLSFGGPTQSRDGRLWHIGHDGLAYSFLELGADRPQREPIDGARLGFANLLYRRGHPVVDEPWSGEQVEDQQEDESLVQPLLRGFNSDRSQPSGLVLRFHKYTGRAEDALADRVIARTTIEWIGRRNVILDEVARLSRPLECVPFVYDSILWLHHPDWNQIRGWRLEELS
ncbi:hypothetical protein [Massilia horti]|uniref:Uncharacterized protein n=1 Tax=Massilia horti TaxID=2562153 RepID=A0A4Y9SPV0_9BURK|nr:hypothetical protein [Massilia horti]TFW28505.1 hypothetical protein E4O92_21085 [Massilia horti]